MDNCNEISQIPGNYAWSHSITYMMQNMSHCNPIWNTPIKLSKHDPVDCNALHYNRFLFLA